MTEPECECGSFFPAKFWTGDGWMCGECYDEREDELVATTTTAERSSPEVSPGGSSDG